MFKLEQCSISSFKGAEPHSYDTLLNILPHILFCLSSIKLDIFCTFSHGDYNYFFGPVFKMADDDLPLCKEFLYDSLIRKDYVLPPYKHPFVTLDWLDGVINQRYFCPHGENFRYRVIPKS